MTGQIGNDDTLSGELLWDAVGQMTALLGATAGLCDLGFDGAWDGVQKWMRTLDEAFPGGAPERAEVGQARRLFKAFTDQMLQTLNAAEAK